MRVRLILMFMATSSYTLRLGFLDDVATDAIGLNKQTNGCGDCRTECVTALCFIGICIALLNQTCVDG